MPSPEQIKAAMPAMRRFLINRVAYAERSHWSGIDDELVVAYTNAFYAGGVERFIKDQERSRGRPSTRRLVVGLAEAVFWLCAGATTIVTTWLPVWAGAVECAIGVALTVFYGRWLWWLERYPGGVEQFIADQEGRRG
jgi:hypothetical protein